ncbi:MAG: hypothetical protein HEQ23_05935 [Tepidisphaera sp.]
MTMRVDITIILSGRDGVARLLTKLIDTLLPPIWINGTSAAMAVKCDPDGTQLWETVSIKNAEDAKQILLKGLQDNGVACYPAEVCDGKGAVWALDDSRGGPRVIIDFDRDLRWQDDQRTIPAVDSDMRHIAEILKAASECGVCGFEWSCND